MNPKIGIGSAQFGMPYGISNSNGQTKEEEVSDILAYATNKGVNIIDTASAYGTSEQVLGLNNLEEFKVVSKFLPLSNGVSLSDCLNKSLINLNIDYLYGYLAHRPMDLLNNTDHWEQLKMLKHQNKVKKIGFSLNEPSELQNLLSAGFYPDLVQVPFNYFDTRFMEALISLKAAGCEVHTRSTFLQGLFLTDVKKLPPFFDSVKDSISTLQLKYGITLPKILLKYVLSMDFVDCIIIGVENLAQLRINLAELGATEQLSKFNGKLSDSILMPSCWPN